MPRQDQLIFRIDGNIPFDPNKPAELVGAMDSFVQLKAHAEKLGIALTKAESRTARVKG